MQNLFFSHTQVFQISVEQIIAALCHLNWICCEKKTFQPNFVPNVAEGKILLHGQKFNWSVTQQKVDHKKLLLCQPSYSFDQLRSKGLVQLFVCLA